MCTVPGVVTYSPATTVHGQSTYLEELEHVVCCVEHKLGAVVLDGHTCSACIGVFQQLCLSDRRPNGAVLLWHHTEQLQRAMHRVLV